MGEYFDCLAIANSMDRVGDKDSFHRRLRKQCNLALLNTIMASTNYFAMLSTARLFCATADGVDVACPRRLSRLRR